MNRRLLAPSLAALLLAAGGAGCGRDNRGSVALTTLCFPPTPDSSSGACVLSATCTNVLANGALEVDLTTSGNTLEFPIQIINERPDNTDVNTGRTNTNFAIIDRFDLAYEAPGFTLPTGFSSQTVSVLASGTTVAEVQLIPASLGAALATALPDGPTDVIIRVKAHGRYGDDTEFDTAEFPVPVAVQTKGALRFGCPAGKTLVGVCPQQGQTAVGLCQ